MYIYVNTRNKRTAQLLITPFLNVIYFALTRIIGYLLCYSTKKLYKHYQLQ